MYQSEVQAAEIRVAVVRGIRFWKRGRTEWRTCAFSIHDLVYFNEI